MAQKSVKKAAAKTAAVKKAPVKKAGVKKTVTTKKTVAAKKIMADQQVVMPAPEMHECMCGAGCHCHRGCSFGRFIKKLIIALIIFALGFAAAKMCCGRHPGMHGPRVHFVNGCVDMASVKCPKLAAEIPNMDINGDGCVSRDEFRAGKKALRRPQMPQAEVEQIVIETVTE